MPNGPTFSPQVEQWRSLVERYFGRWTDKALWVISGESGGNPAAVGDSGVSIGLFQIQSSDRFPSRPDKATLLDPEFNVRYAAEQLGGATGNFGAWGEGSNPPFGALGAHPYPYAIPDAASGSSGGATAPTTGGAILTGFPGIPGSPIPSPGDILDTIGNVVGHLPGGSYVVDTAGTVRDTAGNIIGQLPGGHYIVDGAGKIFDATGSAVGGVADMLHLSVLKQLPEILGNIGRTILWLLDPRHWFRIWFIVAGSAMIVLGAYLYVRGDRAVSDARIAAASLE